MITVLHVIDSLGTGGAEHQLTDLLVRSDRSRFRHVVCSLTPPRGFSDELHRANIELHSLDIRHKYGYTAGILGLRALATHLRPQLLHASLFRAGVIARIVGRLLRIPVVTTLVNTTYEPEWRLDNPHLVGWKVRMLQQVDGLTGRWWGTHFVAISHGVKRSAMRQLGIPSEKITVIPRGFPFEQTEEPSSAAVATVREQVAGGRDPVILNAGRLVPQKGQRYLVEAMSRVVQELPRARLLIAGEGWLRADLEALIRSRGLSEAVTLLGERRDMNVLMACVDMFVFPSLYEGFGVSLLEALALGKPCITSDIEVLREVTDQGAKAVLVQSQSSDALAEAIVRIASDKDLAGRLSGDGARWARERFDIQNSLRVTEALYCKLVDGSASRT